MDESNSNLFLFVFLANVTLSLGPAPASAFARSDAFNVATARTGGSPVVDDALARLVVSADDAELHERQPIRNTMLADDRNLGDDGHMARARGAAPSIGSWALELNLEGTYASIPSVFGVDQGANCADDGRLHERKRFWAIEIADASDEPSFTALSSFSFFDRFRGSTLGWSDPTGLAEDNSQKDKASEPRSSLFGSWFRPAPTPTATTIHFPSPTPAPDEAQNHSNLYVPASKSVDEPPAQSTTIDGACAPEAPRKSAAGTPPLSEDSPWNTPLPANPPVAANSDAIIAKINSWGGPALPAANVFGSSMDFDIPIYIASRSDPLFRVDVGNPDAREQQVHRERLRIPDGAQESGGSDRHFVVVDENCHWAYEFWGLTPLSAQSGALVAKGGGRFRWRGDGFDNANAIASKTAAVAGLVTADELNAGAIEHAIAIMVKSTNNSKVWPASGLAGAADRANAPPNGAWLQYNRNLAQIDRDAATNGWHPTEVTLLKAMSKYGAVVIDTGGASWNIRFQGDASTASLGGGTPMADYAASAEGWSGLRPRYMRWSRTINWYRHLRVLDADALRVRYQARLARKKLDPVATIFNQWKVVGAATADQALTVAQYPPFPVDGASRLVNNSAAKTIEVRVGRPVVPNGKTVSGLILWYYGNTALSSTFSATLLNGTQKLATYSQPAGQAYAWRAVSYNGDMSEINLADIRIRFKHLTGTGFSNILGAFVVTESSR